MKRVTTAQLKRMSGDCKEFRKDNSCDNCFALAICQSDDLPRTLMLDLLDAREESEKAEKYVQTIPPETEL
jgi:hypothetical protein